MKNPAFTPAVLIAFSAVCALGISILMPSAHAQIIANFADGNTNTEVDGYPGMAGDGWASDWSLIKGPGETTFSATVTDSNPLSPGSGNYLALDAENATIAGGNRIFNLRRQYEAYGTVSLGATHTIEFDFRYDGGNGLSRFEFFDSIGNATQPNSSSSFFIRTVGSSWSYGDGSSTSPFENTGLDFNEDQTYRFAITLNPQIQQYDFTITNLDLDESVTITEVEFVGSQFQGGEPLTEVGGTVQWSVQVDNRPNSEAPIREIDWSMDSIAIIPEPTSSALLFGAAGVAALMTRWRQRRNGGARGDVRN